jgi:hypothetical protein
MCPRGNCSYSNLKDQSIKQPKDTAEIETGMTEKSSPGIRQTDGKIKIERNLPNYQRLPLLTVLHLNYFMVKTFERETEFLSG